MISHKLYSTHFGHILPNLQISNGSKPFDTINISGAQLQHFNEKLVTPSTLHMVYFRLDPVRS